MIWMTVTQRMTLFIMKGCHKTYLEKYGTLLVRMLKQTSPKTKVNFPQWMLTEDQ